MKICDLETTTSNWGGLVCELNICLLLGTLQIPTQVHSRHISNKSSCVEAALDSENDPVRIYI